MRSVGIFPTEVARQKLVAYLPADMNDISLDRAVFVSVFSPAIRVTRTPAARTCSDERDGRIRPLLLKSSQGAPSGTLRTAGAFSLAAAGANKRDSKTRQKEQGPDVSNSGRAFARGCGRGQAKSEKLDRRNRCPNWTEGRTCPCLVPVRFGPIWTEGTHRLTEGNGSPSSNPELAPMSGLHRSRTCGLRFGVVAASITS